MKESSSSKSSKRKKTKSEKSWGTPPILESSCQPKEAPVQVSKLDQIQLADTTFYMLYSRVVPPLSETEFNELCEDITQKGILVPVLIGEQYVVIDGKHRLLAALKVGIKQIPIQIHPSLTD